jgi:hypothetical protein
MGNNMEADAAYNGRAYDCILAGDLLVPTHH